MRRITLLLLLLPLIFAACSDSDNENTEVKETEKTVSIKIKATEKLLLLEDKNAEEIKAIDDLFVATTETTDAGIQVVGMHVGKTSVILESEGVTYTYEIEVKANIALYKDPAKFIGKTADEVEAAYGEIAEGSKEDRFYTFKNPYTGEYDNIKFLFDKNNIIIEAIVLLEKKATSTEGGESATGGIDKDKLKGHLADRFEKSAETSSTLVYIDAYKKEDAKNEVRLTEVAAAINGIYVKLWRVVYMKKR